MTRAMKPSAAKNDFAVNPDTSRQALLARLKAGMARVAGPERLSAPAPAEAWRIGLADIDRHLPETGLAPAGLHEIAPASHPDMAAAMGFALALAARRADLAPGPVLWLGLAGREREFGRPYGHGLKGLGLSRARFMLARLKKPADLVWAMEEALRAKALALVIAEAPEQAADLTISRRLSLAAAEGATPGLLLSPKPLQGATAGATRWQVAARPSRPPEYDPLSPGAPCWGVELTRCRGGKPGQWNVEWQHAAHHFGLVSGIPDRALPAHEPAHRPAGPALRAAAGGR